MYSQTLLANLTILSLLSLKIYIDPNSIAGSGDVKYHLGATGNYKTTAGKNITVSVAANSSHLEWVNPVVEGMVQSKTNQIGR